MREMNMQEGILLFDNKGTQEFSDFLIERNDDAIDKIYERLARLQENYWSKNLLPPWGGGIARTPLGNINQMKKCLLKKC